MSDTFHFATGPDDDKPMPVDGAHRWRGMMLNLLDASNDQLKRGGPGSITIDRHQLITRRMEVQMGLIGKTISSLIER